MYKANINVKFGIPKHQYLSCKKFGPIYRALHEDHKDELSVEEFNKIENILKYYFIEGELLYYSTKGRGETLAIPETQVGRGQIVEETLTCEKEH